MLKLFILLVSAMAAPSRRAITQFTFTMNAIGSSQDSVKESHTGQNLIGGIYQQGNYHFTDGTLYDGLLHNCIVDNTYSLHCTSGVASIIKLSVNDLGSLAHDGSDDWLICLFGLRDGSQFIYSSTKPDQSGCTLIKLRTGGYSCTANGTPPSAGAVCPIDFLSGDFQYPYLIVPTSPKNPDTSYGSSHIVYISSDATTLFNFDIPPSYAGRTCALMFLFPFYDELDPAAGEFYYSGLEQEVLSRGGFDFAQLSSTIGVAETYKSTAAVSVEYGMIPVLPGTKNLITKFPCPAGKAVIFKVGSVKGAELDFMQYFGKTAAIGLYIVPCVG